MASSAERQARLRESRAKAGVIQVTVWLPETAAASFKEAAETLCEHPGATVVLSVRDQHTGRWISRNKTVTGAVCTPQAR
jgi:hypothetical protein